MKSFAFPAGSVIQEFGYDEDVDFALRESIEKVIGSELVDEDYPDVADGAVAWWRGDDGDVDDLADLLLDMKANLESDSAELWVFVPGPRQEGSVPADVIKDAAELAGLIATTSAAVAPAWSGVRLTAGGPRR